MYRVASLCTGYGGLELALTHAGIPHQLTWWSEIDRHAATVMTTHTTAPNLGDLRDITNPPPVDIITAGFPCQPVSTAGQRRGVDDQRWLIRDVVTVWRSSGARWLLLENVWGLLTANSGDAFGAVLDALADAGATAEWTCLRASDIGAPHQRMRWFCLADANPNSPGLERRGLHPQRRNQRPTRPHRLAPPPHPDHEEPGEQAVRRVRTEPRRSNTPPPDTDSGEPERRRGPGLMRSTPPTEQSQGLQRQRPRHTPGDSSPTDYGPYEPAIRRWEHITGHPAPNPTTSGRLNPRFVEFMMGLPPGWVTDTPLSRTRQLHVLGNGVVPQQAAAAIHQLTQQQGALAA